MGGRSAFRCGSHPFARTAPPPQEGEGFVIVAVELLILVVKDHPLIAAALQLQLGQLLDIQL